MPFMTHAPHPREILLGAQAGVQALPVCDHYSGVEVRMRKSLQLQAELMAEYGHCVFDVTLDCEDGAPVGKEREHAALVAQLALGNSLWEWPIRMPSMPASSIAANARYGLLDGSGQRNSTRLALVLEPVSGMRMQAGGGGVDGQLAGGDRDAADALVADAEDAFGVGDHDQVDLVGVQVDLAAVDAFTVERQTLTVA